VESQESVCTKGLFGKKKCQTRHHILRPKEGQKLSYLDNEFLEVARKKSFKNFYFGDLSSGQIWLIPLVYDDDS